jgi:putative heme iron utilization protein
LNEKIQKREIEPKEGRKLPDAIPQYTGGLDDVKITQKLCQWDKFQVIVKLANIVLTPDSAFYEGGSWHVEGMRNIIVVGCCTVV